MAFLKNISSGGKKQTPMPGPNSAAYKKIVAARKSAKSHTKSAAKRSMKKPSRPGVAFSSLKSRQALVERLKRQIWASVLKINDAIISLALAGNFQAAKALFDFAGVYSLPPVDDENAVAGAVPEIAPQPEAEGEAPKRNPVEAFFRSIGMPPEAEPEPEAAG